MKSIRKYPILKQRLHQLGLSYKNLAERLDCGHRQVSRLMQGKALWTLDRAYRVLEIIKAQPEEIAIFFPPADKEAIAQ